MRSFVAKNADHPDEVIRDWLHSCNTVEFLPIKVTTVFHPLTWLVIKTP